MCRTRVLAMRRKGVLARVSCTETINIIDTAAHAFTFAVRHAPQRGEHETVLHLLTVQSTQADYCGAPRAPHC